MIRVYTSNRLENLVVQLGDHLRGQKINPMLAQKVVIQSRALEHWLKARLCTQNTILSHMQFQLPAESIWALAEQLLDDVPTENPFNKEALHWQIFSFLGQQSDDQQLDEIKPYLLDDSYQIKRWQLAANLADVFDRYAYYRPELLRQWSKGHDLDCWQAWVWHSICPDVMQHWVGISRQLQEKLATSAIELTQPLNWFAIHQLPPLFMDILAQLGEQIELNIWVLSPSDGYWSDLINVKAQIRKRLQQPEQAQLWETGHELLASWGRQGQALQDLFLDKINSFDEGEDLFEEPLRNSLLGHIQADIFELSEPESKLNIPEDNSIQVHNCHTALRECQVLHDQLVNILDQNKDISAEDILVMVPKMSDYAAYIEAVFARSTHRPFIPWNLNDVSVMDEDSVVQIFVDLLDLPDWRFTRHQLEQLLNVDALRQRFQFTEQDVLDIQKLIDQTHVYWGLDGAHKQSLGLPSEQANTWLAGLQSGLLGLAYTSENSWNGVNPAELAFDMGEVLGRFIDLINILSRMAEQLQESHTAFEWADLLFGLCEQLFEEDQQDNHLQKVRDSIQKLYELKLPDDEKVDINVLKQWFEQQFMQTANQGRPYSGGVTFCAMQPLRGVPFQVIALLGMQDSAFPRPWRPFEFDQMATQWRHGDIRPGDEDRYLFLQTVLSARSKLLFFYTGQGEQDNEPKQASLLVNELLNYIEIHYCFEGKENCVEAISTHYPLQPFSIKNYQPPASADQLWYQFAEAIQQLKLSPTLPVNYPDWRIDAPQQLQRSISASELVNWLVEPARMLLNKRFKLSLYNDSELDHNEEPFQLDNLQSYGLKAELVEHSLRADSITDFTTGLELPQASLGKIAIQKACEQTERLRNDLHEVYNTESQSISSMLALQDQQGRDWEISFELNGLSPHQMTRYRATKIKAKDVVALWVHHLLYFAYAEQPQEDFLSYHLGEDKSVCFAVNLSKVKALEALQKLLDYAHDAMCGPVRIIDKKSAKLVMDYYAKTGTDEARNQKLMDDLLTACYKKDDYPSLASELMLRGVNNELRYNKEFVNQAKEVFGYMENAVWSHG
ncbi:MAG: exodeoxyribonuclease V subunit gamma [bacterium]